MQEFTASDGAAIGKNSYSDNRPIYCRIVLHCFTGGGSHQASHGEAVMSASVVDTAGWQWKALMFAYELLFQ